MPNFLLNFAAFAARILPNSFKQAIYKVKPLARLIRGGLNRAAPPAWLRSRSRPETWQGIPSCSTCRWTRITGSVPMSLNCKRRSDNSSPQVGSSSNVGANIGYVSLLLAKAAGETGKVFAFEALPANIIQLRRNVALNGMNARVTVIDRAVTQAPGPVRFLVHASGGMGKVAGSAGRDDWVESEITIPGVALDGFVYAEGNPPPQVVKMDIEGGEVLALPGMRRVLTEARPLMLMELHGPESCQAAWETSDRGRV